MRICLQCKETIDEDSIFCSYCGMDQRTKEHEHEHLFCDKCGKKIELQSIFCQWCGNRVSISKIPDLNVKEKYTQDLNIYELENNFKAYKKCLQRLMYLDAIANLFLIICLVDETYNKIIETQNEINSKSIGPKELKNVEHNLREVFAPFSEFLNIESFGIYYHDHICKMFKERLISKQQMIFGTFYANPRVRPYIDKMLYADEFWVANNMKIQRLLEDSIKIIPVLHQRMHDVFTKMNDLDTIQKKVGFGDVAAVTTGLLGSILLGPGGQHLGQVFAEKDVKEHKRCLLQLTESFNKFAEDWYSFLGFVYQDIQGYLEFIESTMINEWEKDKVIIRELSDSNIKNVEELYKEATINLIDMIEKESTIHYWNDQVDEESEFISLNRLYDILKTSPHPCLSALGNLI